MDERAPDALLRANLELVRGLEREGQWRRAAEELRRGSGLLERLFDSVHFLLAYMDRQCNFIRVNRAYAAADGRPAESFLGRSHFELYPHAENERIFRHAVESGEPHTGFERPFEYREHPERGITWRVETTPEYPSFGRGFHRGRRAPEESAAARRGVGQAPMARVL